MFLTFLLTFMAGWALLLNLLPVLVMIGVWLSPIITFTTALSFSQLLWTCLLLCQLCQQWSQTTQNHVIKQLFDSFHSDWLFLILLLPSMITHSVSTSNLRVLSLCFDPLHGRVILPHIHIYFLSVYVIAFGCTKRSMAHQTSNFFASESFFIPVRSEMMP